MNPTAMSETPTLEDLNEDQKKTINEILEQVDRKVQDALAAQREIIVEHIRNRVGFWNSNSNVNKAIKRIANEIENQADLRIKQDRANESRPGDPRSTEEETEKES